MMLTAHIDGVLLLSILPHIPITKWQIAVNVVIRRPITFKIEELQRIEIEFDLPSTAHNAVKWEQLLNTLLASLV